MHNLGSRWGQTKKKHNCYLSNYFRDPDKPDESTTKIVQVLDGSDLAIVFNDTEIPKTDIAGACLAELPNGDFLLSNGIDRDNTGVGVKESQTWFVQTSQNYAMVKADKTK